MNSVGSSNKGTIIKQLAILLSIVLSILSLSACGTSFAPNEETTMQELKMKIDGQEHPVIWEDNESVQALMELVSKEPITVEMSMYGGFEQVGPLGTSLPRNDVQITTQAGDIVLYSGNQIVVFYGSNSWAYTRLGNIDLPQQKMIDLLSNGDVTITLE